MRFLRENGADLIGARAPMQCAQNAAGIREHGAAAPARYIGCMVSIKRIYEPAGNDDGYRVLVDRLWPRGVSRDDAALDEWAKAVAPSNGLRRWFGHRPELWTEFQKKYRAELHAGEAAEALANLKKRAESGQMTLLTATRDLAHCHSQVLRKLLA